MDAKTKSAPLLCITVAVASPTELVQRQRRPECPLRFAALHRQPPRAVDHLSCLTANALHGANPNEDPGEPARPNELNEPGLMLNSNVRVIQSSLRDGGVFGRPFRELKPPGYHQAPQRGDGPIRLGRMLPYAR
jgi:hypothetical protein